MMLFRLMTLFALTLALSFSLACSRSSEGDQAAPGGMATPTSPQADPSATPGTPATPDDPTAGPPSAVLKTLADALARGDITALAQMTKETEIDCRTNCPSMGCGVDQCGRVRQGIPMGPWRSEFSLVSRQDLPGTLTRLLATPQKDAADKYGGGALRLYGVGSFNGRIFDAIVTLIQQDGRRAVLLRLDQTEGRWVISSYVVVGISFIDEVLGGNGEYRIVRQWP